MQTTVAILTHTRNDKLEACLQSIRAAGDPCAIVVLDSSPRDDQAVSATIAAKHGATFIGWPEPVTCNYGRRELLAHVQTPWVVYLDDDMTVPQGWLTGLHKHAETHKADVAAMRWVDTQTNAEVSGGRGADRGFTTMCPYSHIGPVLFCVGGATLYRTELLKKTEYRAEFSGCGEDHDQTIQLAQMGAKIIHTDVTCEHHHANATKEYQKQRFRSADIINSQLALVRRHGLCHQAANAITHAAQSQTKLSNEQKTQIMEGIKQWLSVL